MTTTNIQKTIWYKGKARRIRNTRGQRRDLTFWRNSVERDRHVLAFRPANSSIDISLDVYSWARHRMEIVCKPRGGHKRDRITLPLTLHNMNTVKISTGGDNAEQQGRC